MENLHEPKSENMNKRLVTLLLSASRCFPQDSRPANLVSKMKLRFETLRNNKGKLGTDMTRKLTRPYSQRMVIV
jgi:hypothetical protein